MGALSQIDDLRFPDLFQKAFLSLSESDSTAIIDADGNEFSFKELHRISYHFSKFLHNHLRLDGGSMGEDVVIGICMPPSADLVFALWAIMKMGYAYLPFEQNFPRDRIQHMIKECPPRLILTLNPEPVLDAFEDETQVINVRDALCGFKKGGGFLQTPNIDTDALLHERKQPQETFLVMFTSGSSGTPKGVRLGRRALFNRLLWQFKTFPFVPDDVCVFKTSLTFGDSIAEIFAPLLVGTPIVILSKCVSTNPQKLIEALSNYKVTRLVLVPSLLKAILDVFYLEKENILCLDALRLWVCSGEILPRSFLMDFFYCFPSNATLCNFYGSTEVMADVTWITFTSRVDAETKCDANNVPIGYPIDNADIYILDEDLVEAGVGQMGQLFVGGVCLAAGYVGKDKLETDKFVFLEKYNRLVFKTGDYGFKTQEKSGPLFWYCGRLDSQVKVRGCRVDLSHVQLTLSKLEGVAQAVVLSPNPGDCSAVSCVTFGQDIVAFIKPMGRTGKLSEITAQLSSQIKQLLPLYEQPRLVFVHEIPLLVNGKVDRQALIRTYMENQGKDDLSSLVAQHFQPDFYQTAIKCIDLLSQTLKVSNSTLIANVTSSFFALGGNSLNCITAVMALRNGGLFIELETFMNSATILEIVEACREHKYGMDKVMSKPIRNKLKYDVAMMQCCDYTTAVRIIGESFTTRNALEIAVNVSITEIAEYLCSIWDKVIEAGLSFLVKDAHTRQPIGCSINFDLFHRPKGKQSKSIAYIFEMIESLESVQCQNFPRRVHVLRSGYMATAANLSGQENVELVLFMEHEVIQVAEKNNFSTIFTTNTSPLTIQLARDVLEYEILATLHPSHFISADETRPFRNVPVGTLIVCCGKTLNEEVPAR